MKTGAIERLSKIVRNCKFIETEKEGVSLYGPMVRRLADEVDTEFVALKEENAELKNRAEVADNRLGDFLDEYSQNPHRDGKRLARLAQAILNVLQKRYQYGDCGKAYKETIKELNQYLAEENTRTVAELEPLAMTLLGLKDFVGPVPPSMYHRS